MKIYIYSLFKGKEYLPKGDIIVIPAPKDNFSQIYKTNVKVFLENDENFSETSKLFDQAYFNIVPNLREVRVIERGTSEDIVCPYCGNYNLEVREPEKVIEIEKVKRIPVLDRIIFELRLN